MKIEITIPDKEALYGRLYFAIKEQEYNDYNCKLITDTVIKALGIKEA